MKTLRKIFLMVVLVSMFLLAGCTGWQKSTLDTNLKNGKVTHSSINLSILLPSANPVELARAYEITKAADTDAKQAILAQGRVRQLAKPRFSAPEALNTPPEDKFAIGIQNQGKKSIFYYQPKDFSLRIKSTRRRRWLLRA